MNAMKTEIQTEMRANHQELQADIQNCQKQLADDLIAIRKENRISFANIEAFNFNAATRVTDDESLIRAKSDERGNFPPGFPRTRGEFEMLSNENERVDNLIAFYGLPRVRGFTSKSRVDRLRSLRTHLGLK